jgi:hypothetical protein
VAGFAPVLEVSRASKTSAVTNPRAETISFVPGPFPLAESREDMEAICGLLGIGPSEGVAGSDVVFSDAVGGGVVGVEGCGACARPSVEREAVSAATVFVGNSIEPE